MNKVSKINLIYLITVVVSIVGAFIASFLYDFTNNMIYVLFSSQLLLILPALFYMIINKLNLRKTIRFNKVKFSNIILIILFSYLILPLMSLINMISMLFVKNEIQNTVEVIINKNPLLLSLLAIAFIPSILEESVYRGIFYNEYRKINVIKGILLSAFLFALLHMNFNQFFYAFVMGIIFVLLIEATDSILSSMIMHFIINGTSVVNTYMLPRFQDLLREIDPVYAKELAETMQENLTRTALLVTITSYTPFAIITTIIAMIILAAIAKNSKRYEHLKSIFKGRLAMENIDVKKDIEENYYHEIAESENYKRLISVPLIVGIITCLILIILNEIKI